MEGVSTTSKEDGVANLCRLGETKAVDLRKTGKRGLKNKDKKVEKIKKKKKRN